MQEPKAKAALVPFGSKARNDGGGGGNGNGRRAKEGLEGIQENLRIAKEAKRELEGIEEDQEEVLRGGRPRRGGIVRERRKRFEGGNQMQAEISKKIELIEESEYSESGPEDRLSSSQFAAFVAASNSKGTQKGTPNVGTPVPGTPNSADIHIPLNPRGGVGPRRGRGGRSISSGRVKVAQSYDAVSASMRGKIHKDVATMVERLQSVETQTADTRSTSTGIEKGELDSLANEKSPKKHVKVIRSIFEPFPDDWYDTRDVLLHDPLVLAGRRSKSPVPTSRRYPPPRTPTPRNKETTPTPQVTTKRVIAGMERPITEELYARERDDDSPKQQVSVTDHFDTLLATIEAEEEEAKKRRMQRKKDAAVAADREIKKLGIDFDNRLAPSVAAAAAKRTSTAAPAAAVAPAAAAAAASKNPAGAASRGKQPRRTLLPRIRQIENESGISYHVSRNQPRCVALRIQSITVISRFLDVVQ